MTPPELLIYRIAAALFVALCAVFIALARVLPPPYRGRARVFMALCAVAVALMSAVACGGNVGNVTPAPPTQAGPTATPYLYCPPQTEEGITVFCLIIEPTPSDATRAVYATRLAEWDALGTPTRAEWATMDAATTAMAATVAAVAATDTAEALATRAADGMSARATTEAQP